MAYNPFNVFRRNQKAIFAVITVIIMFMFVLSSGMAGKADFFNWLPDWIRGKRAGETICTIDGSKVSKRDLEALRFQRIVASKFMQKAGREAYQQLRRSLIEASSRASPEYKDRFVQMITPANANQFQTAAIMVSMIKDDPKAKEADKEAARIAEAMLALTNSPGIITPIGLQNDRDMIEFMLWRKKAHQLGISYSVDDAKMLVSKEFMGSLKSDVEARKELREEYKDRYTDDLLFKALAAEFEVRTVFSAVLGIQLRPEQTLNAPLVVSPPYELFEFYRDKTSGTNYDALRIPVEAFIPQVTQQPTEDELQRLFNDRKDYEPDPAKEEPGFREPRKIKLEWVSVTGEEPYYQKAAKEWLQRTEMLAKSEVRALVVPTIGMGPVSWAAIVAAPASLKEPLVQEKYQREVVQRHQSRIGFGWTGPTTYVLPSDILETSTVQPQNLASVAGGIAGAVGTGNMLLPVNLAYTATLAAEQKTRIKAAMPLVLAGTPGPNGLAKMVAAEAVFRKNLPEALPLEAYKPELIKELGEAKARELAISDLKKLKESVDKLTETGKSREAAARDLIAEFIKTRGVKTGASTELHGEYTIGDDPGLAPLKAVLDDKENNPHAMFGMSGPIQFGKSFFWNSLRREAATGLYQPEFYPEGAAESALRFLSSGLLPKKDPVFLAWRTADQQGRGATYGEAKPRVVEAWKRKKARELAKAEADRLAAEMRNKPGESAFLINQNLMDMAAQLQSKSDPRAKDKIKTFRIENVAPEQIISEPGGMSMGLGRMVLPFALRPTKDIPYPAEDMGKTLLAERTKPEKTTFVMVDQPKDNYYVTVLERRDEQSPMAFRMDMYDSSPMMRSGVRGQLLQLYHGEALKREHETVLAMLKKEFNYTETEEQKKRMDEKKDTDTGE
jgi:hypothetical protein